MDIAGIRACSDTGNDSPDRKTDLMPSAEIQRSLIIPVLDFSPHSPFNIHTLLADLQEVSGEVVCIFNSLEVFEALRHHPRIDKFCFNKSNAGVSRSWNMGINLSEG